MDVMNVEDIDKEKYNKISIKNLDYLNTLKLDLLHILMTEKV